MSYYSAAVLERVRDPKYAGWLPRDAPDVGTGEAATREGSTLTRIQVRIDGSTRRVQEVVFKASGDTAAIASASLVAERLHGATLEEAQAIDGMAIVAELELPIEGASVAGLAVAAARSAIAEWERKTNERATTR